MPAADFCDVTLIVRECGERTADACTALLAACFPGQTVHRVTGHPFHSTLRNSLELGLRERRKWTLCIDADVLVLPSIVEFVASAKALPAGMLGMQGLVYDKLLGVTRPAGNHLYQTELIATALPHIPVAGALRPESAMIEAMAAAGMPFHQSYQVIGLHDFEQYLRDIYAKAFLHGHKHRYLLKNFQPIWNDLANSDDDFKVALAALGDSNDAPVIFPVGRDRSETLAKSAIERLGLSEKLPLGTLAPVSAEQILMAEQAQGGEVANLRAKLQQVMDADLNALAQARQVSGHFKGQAIAICMLALAKESQRIGELLELSGKYIAAGADVYWVTLDVLSEEAGFALPPGVRWLRLCEPGLSNGGIRASIAIATKLVPVFNDLNPAKIISFQRAARHAVWLARFAAGSTPPLAARLSQTDNTVPKWLQYALQLVSPQRYQRLRNEAIAARLAVDEIFDAAWYGEQYRAGISKRSEMARYFLHVGQYLGHSPHPLLRASWYGRLETSFAFGPSPIPPWRPAPLQTERPSTYSRVAICQVSTGEYDAYEPLVYRQPNADYFFLTDRPCAINEMAGWRFIHVAAKGKTNPLLLSREIKMNLARFVPAIEQYSVVVYIDGNVDPVGDLSPMIDDFLLSEAELGVIPHPFRQTVYTEAAAIILQVRDSRERVMKVVEMLEAEKCPNAAGLFEMNMFFFRPGKASKQFFDAWWRLYQEYGRRDQLLAPLVAWKLGTKLHALMPPGHSVRNHPALCFRPHRRESL